MKSWAPAKYIESLGAEAADPLLGRSLNQIGLSRRTANALTLGGFRTVEDILRVGPERIGTLRNVGTVAIMEIEECLAKLLPPATRVARDEPSRKRVDDTGNRQRTSVRDSTDLACTQNEPVRKRADRSLEFDTVGDTLAAGLKCLAERDRVILARRFPNDADQPTLDSIAAHFGVTRERIRQIVARATKRLGETNHLRATLLAKCETILSERKRPAFLEMLEAEDPWFRGIDTNPIFARHLVSTWSINTLHVWKWDIRHIVTRITKQEWKALRRETEDIVAGFASTQLPRRDVRLLVEATARQRRAKDLSDPLVTIVDESAQYGLSPTTCDEVLLGFGRDYKTLVRVIFLEAKAPLAIDAIRERYLQRVGLNGRSLKTVTASLRNALRQPEVYQFSQRRYGNRRHFGLTPSQGEEIRQAAEDLVATDSQRQWHCSEMVEPLSRRLKFASQLDQYAVEAFLRDSQRLVSLKRLVWAVRDSSTIRERRQIDDLLVKALARAGGPLSTKALRKAVSTVRGIRPGFQVVASDRIIAMGRGRWGLRGRDA